MAIGSITHHVELGISPAEAFSIFTVRLGDWWPLAYTFSGSHFAGAAIEPRVGGEWYEVDLEQQRRPWGDVRACEPGRRIVLGFAIGADRQPTERTRASEVEVRFLQTGDRTRVEVEHRDFDRHGEDAQALRDGMDSPQGWPLILAELRREVERRRATRVAA